MLILKLDSFLLSLMQKFCDKMQRTTGLTKFFFEKWSLILISPCYWMLYFSDFDTMWLFISIGVSVCTFVLVPIIGWQETEFLKKGLLRLPVGNTPILRIICILFLIFDVTLVYTYGNSSYLWAAGGMTLTTSWYYLECCIPHPPSKSKARELYEKGLSWLGDILEPGPSPLAN